MKLRVTAFGLILLSAAACQQLATDPHDVQVLVQTEGATFVRAAATSFAEVPFRVENQGNSTIYLARCGERLTAVLDRWEGGQWVQHSGDACQAIYAMNPVPLAPGAWLSNVRGVPEPGRYRLRPGIVLTAGEPSEWTVVMSNEFTVE